MTVPAPRGSEHSLSLLQVQAPVLVLQTLRVDPCGGQSPSVAHSTQVDVVALQTFPRPELAQSLSPVHFSQLPVVVLQWPVLPAPAIQSPSTTQAPQVPVVVLHLASLGVSPKAAAQSPLLVHLSQVPAAEQWPVPALLPVQSPSVKQ